MPDDVVIAWEGDIDLDAVERLLAEVDRTALDTGGRRLVLDFEAVGFVAPVAVRALVHASNRATERGMGVLLRAMPADAKRLLAMTGLTELFEYDDPPLATVAGDGLPWRASLPALPDDEFDTIAALVQQLLDVPTALVSLVDREQQVFPGAVGLPDPWQGRRSTALSHSFCKYVVDRAAPLVVNDATADPVFADNPAIPDLGVVAYAGMPVTDVDGRVVGALCAIDSRPRTWNDEELHTLHELAGVCSAALRLRTLARRAGTSATPPA